jgi:DNA-binding NtrC family response regulator
MSNRRRKVLIIDGHEPVLMALERLLEDEGFRTVGAWSAKEALARIESGGFDLILVNEYLPDADAEFLLRKLSEKHVASPCMVMYPGSPKVLETRRYRMLGAVDVISKNNHRALLEAVQTFFSLAADKTCKQQEQGTEGNNHDHSSYMPAGSQFAGR